MKRITQMIALILSLITVLGLLAACANTSGGETTAESASTTAPSIEMEEATTAEETLFENDSLDDKYDFGETVTVFMWANYTMLEFYAKEDGGLISEAIVARNSSVEERLGITLEFVEENCFAGNYATTWVQKAANDQQADNTYDIYAGYSQAVPYMAIKGMTADLLEYEAFNVSKPWWPAALTEECTINDKLYFCSGDISTNLLWMMIGTFYNTDLYEQYFPGEKSPMDMVEDNEWTMEKFFGMTRDLYTDDGNGIKDISDTYGCILYATNIDAFQTAAGIISIEKDDTSGLKISEGWKSQRCADVCDLVGEFIKGQGVYYQDDISVREIFFQQRGVFITDRLFIVAGKDTVETAKIEFSYGLVPQPKYEASQENFMTNVGHTFTMYAANPNSPIIEAAVTTLEAMGSANHRSVTPVVFEVAMKVRYTDNPQTARMYDIIRENISFDIGRLFSSTFRDATANTFRTTATSANPSSFLTNVKKNEKVIQAGIKTLMEFYGK